MSGGIEKKFEKVEKLKVESSEFKVEIFPKLGTVFPMFERLFLKKNRYWFWFLGIGILIWGISLGFDLTFSDDNALIRDNQVFLHNFQNIFRAFLYDDFQRSMGGVYYRPLVINTLIWDTQWQFSAHPWLTYHVTNILLHVFATGLFFQILKRFRIPALGAAIAALIFLVHPVNAQTVAWITGRVDSVFTIWVLLSFHAILNFQKNPTTKNGIWYFLAFLGALFSKETAVVLPVLHWIVLWVDRQKKIFHPPKLPVWIAWIVAFPIWFFARENALQSEVVGVESSKIFTAQNFSSFFENIPATIPHLGKIFFPLGLSPHVILSDLIWWPGIFTVSVLGAAVIFLRKKISWPIIFLGGAIFLTLWPTFLNPDPDQSKFFLENRLYFPAMGMFLIVAELLRASKISKKFLVAGAGIFFLFSGITLAYQQTFRDGFSYWGTATELSPTSAFAFNNFGAMYYLANDLENAEKEWLRSLELHPTENMVNGNLGLLYLHQGELEKSEKYLLFEIEINPAYDHARHNLGLLYEKQGKIKKAVESWEKLIMLHPRYWTAYKKLLKYYESVGDTAKIEKLQQRFQKFLR
ncbi:tetratricopeptide repeat protein [bacterium]|nr:tetratricopeptide repeat protein [bacterium]